MQYTAYIDVVFSSQNVIWFHSTHDCNFNPTRKYGLHCAEIHQLKIIQWTAVHTSPTEFYPSWIENVENTGKI
jgi:hypothetical protein